MDETGRFSNVELIPPSSSYTSDSRVPPEQPKQKNADPPDVVVPESADNVDDGLDPVSLLQKVILESIFKFRDKDDKDLLTDICETIERDVPGTRMDMGDLIDMFYAVSEGASITSVVTARLHRDGKDAEPQPMEGTGEPTPNKLPGPQRAKPDKKAPKLKDVKQELVCKVCWDNVVAVTFVPCGHLVTCIPCTSALFECPVCRAQIRGTIRTYV